MIDGVTYTRRLAGAFSMAWEVYAGYVQEEENMYKLWFVKLGFIL